MSSMGVDVYRWDENQPNHDVCENAVRALGRQWARDFGDAPHIEVREIIAEPGERGPQKLRITWAVPLDG